MTKRVALIAVALLGAGCASAMMVQRYPSRPPAGMSAAQAATDQKSCVDDAERASRERSWAYIGCMVSKGHEVAVAFQVRGTPAHMYVAQRQPHDPGRVVSELSDCRVTAYAAGRAESKQGRDVMVQQMESTFRSCIDPLGYTIKSVQATVFPETRR